MSTEPETAVSRQPRHMPPPSQKPPAHIAPLASFVDTQLPALLHVSAVHSLPSSQFAALKHSTHVFAEPLVSQKGVAPEQPISVPDMLESMHASQTAGLALVSHTGVEPPQRLASPEQSTQTLSVSKRY